jgi:hypothetical protein
VCLMLFVIEAMTIGRPHDRLGDAHGAVPID